MARKELADAKLFKRVQRGEDQNEEFPYVRTGKHLATRQMDVYISAHWTIGGDSSQLSEI